MPSLRILKSVTYNLGHHYLSLMNYRHDDYVVEHLFKTAKATGASRVAINVLECTIEPAEFSFPAIQESVADLKHFLWYLTTSQGLPGESVRGAWLSIEFDLSRTQMCQTVPGLELAVYKCETRLEDLNGKEYLASVSEWWKYG
ncbi:MAG: hypothetical protein H7Y22_12480 [Gemmatimonadaceae bacterium]|nr:hypothetical protein [Gloeobacterales cyanobacterium ES-bin-141]